ncbi:MAG: cellulase family glycosylhydrolase [Anaerolineae bacterium]|nr:cellulase family glycosylhydrolase [Anaerolineae bacterium]
MVHRGGLGRGIPWPWTLAVSVAAILSTALFLTGCNPPISEALEEPVAASPLPSPSPSPTPTVTPAPTITPLPPPTLHPTPLPTIVIPMLTRTAPMTRVAGTLPELWTLPERVVPEPFGVEIHFTRASQNELDYLAAGGFRWIRMDMFWHTIETDLGRYTFAAYDSLVEEMNRRGIRIVFILDYGNPLYDHGYPPTSPGGQAAFASFAAIAAKRYRDKGIVWEIWNEPNVDHFWVPEANAQAYGELALRTIAAIRSADPTALVVAPATSGYDYPFWHALGKMGLFTKVDAVTVHSYGVRTPEELTGPLLKLRALVNGYSPGWKVPVLSGEWGFYSTEGGYTEGQQGQLLARQWLVNLMHDIDLSIWYDWRDDGLEPDNPEHNFGTVHNDYTVKPAYRAAQTIATHLEGYQFLRSVPLERPDDYLLLFGDGARTAFAMWTTGIEHTVILPVSVYEVAGVNMVGDPYPIESEGEGLAVSLSSSPRYLLFRGDQAPAYLGGWRPLDTINCLTRGPDATIPVVISPYESMPLYGELQVWARGALRGSASVRVEPLMEARVRVPVDLDGLTGNVPAELRFVLQNPAMADLQTAAIWLQITEMAETTP